MCKRWLDDFDAFMDDMGSKPGPEYSIERLDNDQGYDPFNCIWATVRVQARNRRNNRWLTFEGRTMVVEDWAKETGHAASVLLYRIEKGFSIDEILEKGSLVNAPQHGTMSMYVSRKCRCEPCRQANRNYMAANRHRFASASNEYRNRKYAERKNG